MAAWRYRIQLNEVIAWATSEFDLSEVEKECPDQVKNKIAEELRKAFPLQRFASKILQAKSIAEVNRILEKVFDTADSELVWCGFAI